MTYIQQRGVPKMHLTNKKKLKREQNNRKRGMSPINTGTRNMGFKSNNDRKQYLAINFYE